jgi:hypothetical protein
MKSLENLCNLWIRIAKRLFFADTPARIELFAFLRAFTRWIPGASRCCGRDPGADMEAGGRAASGIHESCIGNVAARQKKYINILINILRFSPQRPRRTQRMYALFQIFAPPCRTKSAFICVYLRFRIALRLFSADTSARTKRFAFLRASPGWIPGAARWTEHRGGYGDRGTRRLWDS